MTASFPTSIKTFTTKLDNYDYPQAEHINSLQDEVVALETAIGAGGSNNILTCISCLVAAFNPADSTTYYVGGSGVISTTIGNYGVKLPKSGNVKYVQYTIYTTGTLASSENVTVGYYAAGTSVPISTTVQLTAFRVEGTGNFASSPYALTTSSIQGLYITTPAWATNPTNVIIRSDVYWTPTA